MDSQHQSKDGGGGPLSVSTSTPLLSPQPSHVQLHPTLLHQSKCPLLSTSPVLSGVPSLEYSPQHKPSRPKEIAAIDRATLAQKFSVTRRLFETKVMEVDGGQGSKVISARGSSRGVVEGREEEEGKGVSQLGKPEEEHSPARRESGCREENEEERAKPSNLPEIHIISPGTEPPTFCSLASHSNTLPSTQDHPSELLSISPIGDTMANTEEVEGPLLSPVLSALSQVPNTCPPSTVSMSESLSSLEEQTRSATPRREVAMETEDEMVRGLTLDPCLTPGDPLTPDDPVRAELVHVKNESSESDEEEGERRRDDMDGRLDEREYEEKGEEALVDDVFYEPGMEPSLLYEMCVEHCALEHRTSEPRSVEDGPVVASGQQREDLLTCTMLTEDQTEEGREARRDTYQQVTEHREGEREEQIVEDNSQFTAGTERFIEEGDSKEKKMEGVVEENAGEEERGKMEEEDVEEEDNLCNEGMAKGSEEHGERECQVSEGQEWAEREGEGKEEEGDRLSERQEEHANVEENEEKECSGNFEEQVEDKVRNDKEGGEDHRESSVICGIENKAFVDDRERELESRPEDSESPRLDWESSPDLEEKLSLEYQEIPGLSELSDQEDEEEEAGKRKIKFSTAPIKVRLIKFLLIGIFHSLKRNTL